MICIILNSIILAIFDYKDRDIETGYNNILDAIGRVLTIVFLIEAIIKIYAMGFFLNQKAYLRDTWNLIDFAVVVTGLLELFDFTYNLKSLRTFRVLRPLKSINAIPSMRSLISALIRSLPDFVNVAAFLCFNFLLFGILGLHVFQDAYFYQCRMTEKPINATYWPRSEVNRLCSPNDSGDYSCPID